MPRPSAPSMPVPAHPSPNTQPWQLLSIRRTVAVGSAGIEGDVIGRVAVEVRRRPLAYKEKRRGRGEFALRRTCTRGELELRRVRNAIGIPKAALSLEALEIDVAGKGFVSIRGHGLMYDEVRCALPGNTFTIAWIENGARDRLLDVDR